MRVFIVFAVVASRCPKTEIHLGPQVKAGHPEIVSKNTHKWPRVTANNFELRLLDTSSVYSQSTDGAQGY